jgi:hypothetical protein
MRILLSVCGRHATGLARLIDSYADGLIDKQECEPRLLRLRRRIAQAEEQRQQLVEAATLQTELQLIIGRLEDFATQVHHGLAEADWGRKRDLIRALVKRVAVAQDDVNIVFRIDPYPSDADPEKKSLQLCRESGNAGLGQLLRLARRVAAGRQNLQSILSSCQSWPQRRISALQIPLTLRQLHLPQLGGWL